MMINRDFSLLDPNATYTYRDYLQWDFTERIELILGKIFPMSLTVRRDLHEKLNIYETFGVREYWIVHPKDKTMLIMTPDKDGYYRPSRLMTTGDVIDSRIFPGLKLDLDELFADVVQEPELLYGDNVVRI
ncbi:MAG: Uma2 family endonuclease [Cyclobacteriaceae bacterium]